MPWRKVCTEFVHAVRKRDENDETIRTRPGKTTLLHTKITANNRIENRSVLIARRHNRTANRKLIVDFWNTTGITLRRRNVSRPKREASEPISTADLISKMVEITRVYVNVPEGTSTAVLPPSSRGPNTGEIKRPLQTSRRAIADVQLRA